MIFPLSVRLARESRLVCSMYREGELFICTALGSEIHREMFLLVVVVTGFCVVINCLLTYIFLLLEREGFLFIHPFVHYHPSHERSLSLCHSLGAAEISHATHICKENGQEEQIYRNARMYNCENQDTDQYVHLGHALVKRTCKAC